MPKRTATVAYENPRTNRAEAKYFAEVRQRLDAMGAPNSGELLHTSRVYVEGAHRGDVGADVAAAVIWHQHCRTGVTPDKKDCSSEAGAASECPAETAAECPPGASPKPAVVVVAGEEPITDRRELGIKMHEWHAGQGDPLYAVGSYYYTGQKYPDREVVERAETEIEKLLRTRSFSGGKRGEKKDLRAILGGIRHFMAIDYPAGTSEANDSIPACAPFTQVVKDPQKFAACQVRAKQIGPLEDDRKMYEFLRSELEKQDQEIFVVVGLDLHRNVRSYDEVARGQRDRVAVSAEDVLRPVILSGCHAFVISHNHPSGSANPSKKDGELTETIRNAARVAAPNCVFLDHLIIGSGEYFSFADSKLKRG
jgi:DNA repair protein RadC